MREQLRRLHRRLLPLGVAATLAAGAAGACSSGSSASSTDAGATVEEDANGEQDAGLPSCLFDCNPEAGLTPEETDASLPGKVAERLGLCVALEGCHVSGAGQLTFPPANRFANLINVKSSERPDLYRVKPGDPSNSYLYLKVLGDGGIEGGRMPLGAATFDPRIPETIWSWIEAGAPDD